jgi:hypothetical protein
MSESERETRRLEALRHEMEHGKEPTPLPPPEIEVLQQMLSETLSREMAARAEVVRLRRQAQK